MIWVLRDGDNAPDVLNFSCFYLVSSKPFVVLLKSILLTGCVRYLSGEKNLLLLLTVEEFLVLSICFYGNYDSPASFVAKITPKFV